MKTREKLDAFREPEDSDAAVSKRKSSTELGKTSANQSVTNSTSLDEGFSGCEVNGVYLEWHMRQALKPILFDDHDKAAADAARTSIVAKAKRSTAAARKALTKRTDDGLK